MNYGEIKGLFKDTLNRSDITDDLTATFITQAVQRVQRLLRGPINETTTDIELTGTGSIDLPRDFLELKIVYSGNAALDRVATERFLKLSSVTRDSAPKFFVRQANKLLIWPTPSSGVLTLVYYAKPEQFSTDDSSTVLSDTAPDIIVYGALSYAADYFLDDRAPVFEQRFLTFMSELQERAYDQEMNGGIQAIPLAGDF